MQDFIGAKSLEADALSAHYKVAKRYLAAKKSGDSVLIESVGIELDNAELALSAASKQAIENKPAKTNKIVLENRLLVKRTQPTQYVSQNEEARDFRLAYNHIDALIEYNYWLNKYTELCM